MSKSQDAMINNKYANLTTYPWWNYLTLEAEKDNEY